MFRQSTLVIFVLALSATITVNAALWNSPIKQRVDQAVQDAVNKILQSFGNTANTIGQTVDQTHQVLGAVTQPVTQAVGQMGQQIVNDYSAMGQQIKSHYNSLGQQFVGHIANMGGYFGTATDQLEAVIDAYQAQFCAPAIFKPSVKKPAKFVGPEIVLEINSGACSFNETALIVEGRKMLNCTEPAIKYAKVPASFTSKHKAAPVFSGKRCIVEKEFGETLTKVLYVFDGQSPMDPAQLTNQIVGEIKQLLGAAAGHFNVQNAQNQMQQFLGSFNLPGMSR